MRTIPCIASALLIAVASASGKIKWRIDQSTQPAHVKGHWYALSYYSDWGQMQCQVGGYQCHLYDWLTWWESTIQEPDPTPQGGPTIYGEDEFPTGYDESTGYY